MDRDTIYRIGERLATLLPVAEANPMSTKIKNFIRLPLWWNHIVPPILSVVYFLLLKVGFLESQNFFRILLFLFSIVGIAGFGYFVNDWTDIQIDQIAGKSNGAAALRPHQRILMVILLLVIGLAPWLVLPVTTGTLGLLFILILFLLMYSLPPFRLKERNFWACLYDLHYGHVLPVFIAFNTFSIIWGIEMDYSGLGLVLYALLFLKGFRNINLHQIEDRKNDRLGEINTFVLDIGVRKSIQLVNICWILEVILTGLFLWMLEPFLIMFWLFFLSHNVFLLIWQTETVHTIQYWYLKFWYFFNDFYEIWLPISFLLWLIWINPSMWWLFFLHLLFFPKAIQTVRRDFKSAFSSSRPYQIKKWLGIIQ